MVIAKYFVLDQQNLEGEWGTYKAVCCEDILGECNIMNKKFLHEQLILAVENTSIQPCEHKDTNTSLALEGGAWRAYRDVAVVYKVIDHYPCG